MQNDSKDSAEGYAQKISSLQKKIAEVEKLISNYDTKVDSLEKEAEEKKSLEMKKEQINF